MTTRRADLAIIGGGCAGLSLARALIARKSGLTIEIIEPRTEYPADRTWCFWASHEHALQPLIEARWSRWRFSDAANAMIEHSSKSLSYQMLPASNFYAAALSDIASAPNITLQLGERVEHVESFADYIALRTTAGTIKARQVVDTRPERQPRAQLFQVFAGTEVKTTTDTFNPDCAGLMMNMGADETGFHFDYVLPLSPRRALVEWTRFSKHSVRSDQIAAELEHCIGRHVREPFTSIRSEAGCLPMGQVKTQESMQGLLRAGMGGGALRAATGYGFLRIQTWAEHCAEGIVERRGAVAHPVEPELRAWMDRVFLATLRAQPQRGPDFFMRLARSLSPDAFVRFMSDAATAPDLLGIIMALPVRPLVATALSPAIYASAGPAP